VERLEDDLAPDRPDLTPARLGRSVGAGGVDDRFGRDGRRARLGRGLTDTAPNHRLPFGPAVSC
jgi:hypothetical protein